MNFLNKNAGVIALVALIIAIGVWAFSSSPKGFGATSYCPTSQTTCLPSLELTGNQVSSIPSLQINAGGLLVGTNGTSISKMINGSGALIYSDSQVSASTTKAFDIAVTGVVPGDNVSVQLSTTTVPAFGAWVLTGASASSTSGYITVQIANFTGATANLPRQIASSTYYKVTN